MSGPPDPSKPDQYREMIRNEVSQILSDPLQLPDELLTWLQTFTNLNRETKTITIPPALTTPFTFTV